MILCLPETHPAEQPQWCAALSEPAQRSASLSCTAHSGAHIIITETSHHRNRNQPSWEQKPVIVGNRNQSLWNRNHHYGNMNQSAKEQEPVIMGTGTSHHGHRDQSLWEQEPVTMGTGTSHYGNRNQSAELMKTTRQQRNRNPSFWEQDPVTTGTGTSHYGNRNQSLQEQEPLQPVTAGTGTNHYGNRNRNQSLIITSHHRNQSSQ